jgi:2-polyprenyl-3-methyl-5-hydroxy-6-metoxy-1,4-benzoquinol methylase
MTSWVRYTATHPMAVNRPLDYVELGPDISNLDRRLIGDVAGKRVLDLGCGMGHGAVALARQGAKVFAVDPDAAQLALARDMAEREGVKIEVHQSDVAELAFLRNASIDLVVSVFALAAVDDLDRVLRQVHRVLQPNAPFILSLPHPLSIVVQQANDGTLRMTRRFRDRTPLGEGPLLTYPHTISDLHAGLARANFRVDVLLEPESSSGPWRSALTGWVPSTLVLRARKEGT